MRTRTGMTLIEVMIAMSILVGALLGMGRFITGFQHATSNGSVSSTASDLVQDRLETIKGYNNYASLETTFNGTESSISGYPGYKRTTTITRTVNATTDYKAVTVTVTYTALNMPVKKSTIIASF